MRASTSFGSLLVEQHSRACKTLTPTPKETLRKPWSTCPPGRARICCGGLVLVAVGGLHEARRERRRLLRLSNRLRGRLRRLHRRLQVKALSTSAFHLYGSPPADSTAVCSITPLLYQR